MITSKYQQGAATIWYIFLIGAIMSLGALAIEGSRYIGKKARLGDALEAGSIAVASNDRVVKKFEIDSKMPSGRSARETAKIWLHHYLVDDTALDIKKVERKEVSNSYGKDELITPYKVDYFRYDLEATSTHDSWFRFTDWARFKDKVDVANTGAAGRIKGNHEPADVVFVADFSGSMNSCYNERWGEYRCRSWETSRLGHLKLAIDEVTKALLGVNSKSTFGFIPFNRRIVIERNNKFYCTSPMLAPKNSDFDKVRRHPSFADAFRLRYSKYSNGPQNNRSLWYTLNDISTNEKAIFESYYRWLSAKGSWGSGSAQSVDYPRNVWSVRDAITGKNTNIWFGENWLKEGHISISRTATDITIKDKPLLFAPMEYGGTYYDYYKPNFGSYCGEDYYTGDPLFYSLERNDFNDRDRFVSQVNGMRARGGTHMYQGLAASPHQFYGATNNNRYIIVLSDGVENSDMFSRLVNQGLCENMRNKLEEREGKYNVKMFVVGIGFDPGRGSGAKAYNKCFGKDNIYPVHDLDKLKDVILGLFADDIGHNFER
ncbi:Tad domain-containing protein [Vibrio europaeus]|uniref:Tad domain-containing protein n=1 Tax=Vibrio europaeus TaxID=300876 RepID=UPI0039E1B2BF